MKDYVSKKAIIRVESNVNLGLKVVLSVSVRP